MGPRVMDLRCSVEDFKLSGLDVLLSTRRLKLLFLSLVSLSTKVRLSSLSSLSSVTTSMVFLRDILGVDLPRLELADTTAGMMLALVGVAAFLRGYVR